MTADEGKVEDLKPEAQELAQLIAHELVPVAEKMAGGRHAVVVLCVQWNAGDDPGSDDGPLATVTLGNCPPDIIETVLKVALLRSQRRGADFRGKIPVRTS